MITSNRDEAPARHASEIHAARIGDQQVHYPRDPKAGGSWFAWADNGSVACLLNGAHTPFMPSDQHTLSRGTVLLDSFKWAAPGDFIATYDFTRAGHFTLLLLRRDTLHQLIWDGASVDHTLLDTSQPHFWSSVTLYPQPVREWRRKLFEEWRSGKVDYLQDEIIEFHRFGGRGDEKNDFVMNRGGIVQTLSISSVQVSRGQLSFQHVDLQAPEQCDRRIMEIADFGFSL